MFEAYFEAQGLCFCEFWQFEGVEGQMCADVPLLMHKNFIFVICGFWFLVFDFFEGERGQMCTNIKCLMHILK